MTIFGIYSKLKKKVGREAPLDYRHVELSDELRAHILQIWDETIGLRPNPHRQNPLYAKIVREVYRKYGLRRLHQGGKMSKREELREWFVAEPDVERCLYAVEVSFRMIDGLVRKFYPDVSWQALNDLSPDQAIAELNRRLKEAGTGLKWEAGFIVRANGSAR